MPYIPYLFEWSPLYFVQAALTIWMLVDANRRGVDYYWFLIILAFQPLGPWVYFFLYKVKDFRGGRGWPAGLLQRRASLEELRHRAERLPTAANRLELGERLVETGMFAEAVPHLGRCSRASRSIARPCSRWRNPTAVWAVPSRRCRSCRRWSPAIPAGAIIMPTIA